jgi:transposase-like protein
MSKCELMTQKEYLKHNGTLCPNCKSDNITAGPLETDGMVGWANAKCDDCEFEWQDLWKLTGWSDILNEI